jgi:hypothetical protein
MAKQYDRLDDRLTRFLTRQHIFFVASATADSRVNVSPKGLDTLRVIDANRVCYLDYTGSGSETAAHLAADGRLTLMVCAFEGPPMILRLYGRGAAHRRGTPDYAALLVAHFDGRESAGARQIVTLDFDLVQTSCGYAVPLYGFEAQRDTLTNWAEQKGADGLDAYRREKNRLSMDGLPTGLIDD